MANTSVLFAQYDKGGIDMKRFDQATAWCYEQFGPGYLKFHDEETLVWTFRLNRAAITFFFADMEHALLFKLTWGGVC